MDTNRRHSVTTSVLVTRIQTVPLRDDVGRFVIVTPISGRKQFMFPGAIAEYCTAGKDGKDGVRIFGKVTDMSEEIQAGKFPAISGEEVIVDTKFPQKTFRPKRMAQGGITAQARRPLVPAR